MARTQGRLFYGKCSGTVKVPGTNGHKMQAAIENTRIALLDNSASSIQVGIDAIAASVDDAFLK